MYREKAPDFVYATSARSDEHHRSLLLSPFQLQLFIRGQCSAKLQSRFNCPPYKSSVRRLPKLASDIDSHMNHVRLPAWGIIFTAKNPHKFFQASPDNNMVTKVADDLWPIEADEGQISLVKKKYAPPGARNRPR